MDYRIGMNELFATLAAWDELISARGKIHLIACGGTALTLMGYKESTKDVDFLIPNEKEHDTLIRFLAQAGYEPSGLFRWRRAKESIVYDLYRGNRIYVNELLSSPLEPGGHRKIREWKKIYLGVLNPVDLIISKMFRGSDVDIQDCLILLEKVAIDRKSLEKRYRETAQYDNNPERVLGNLDALIKRWEGEK